MKQDKLFSAQRRAKRNKFYGTGIWKRIRKIQLQRSPLCVQCQKYGKQTVATVCDHIDPSWDPSLESFVKGPFQSLCRECHQDKTGEDYSKLKKAEMLKVEVWE